ncbi:MAG: PAS domain-containing protein, partial [Deltaproteobacteria bacterium]|nr:PAS domain-containing protein [Deltaproteobacteria bacterium]
MIWERTPLIIILSAVAVVSALLAYTAWRRQGSTRADAFIWLMLAVTWWAAAYLAQLAESNMLTESFWAQVKWFGLVAIAGRWLIKTGRSGIIPLAGDTLVENMIDAVFILDLTNKLVRINPAAERIIGLSAEDALGHSGEDIFVQKARLSPGWCREIMIHTEVVLGEGEEQGHYDFRLSPLYDHRGRLTGRLLLLRDITQTVRGEEALHRKVEELTILNAVAVAGSEVGNKLDLIKRTAEVLFRTRFSGKIDLLLFEESADKKYDTLLLGTPCIVEQDRRRRPTPGLRIPINVADMMIGVIQTENSRTEALTDSDVRFLTILAGQLATGIEKIRLFDAERRHRQEADTLRQAAASLTSDLDLKQVLDNILIQLEHVVPNDSSYLIMLQGDTLQTVAARGLGAD